MKRLVMTIIALVMMVSTAALSAGTAALSAGTASAGGKAAFQVHPDSNYRVNTYTDDKCTTGHRTLGEGQGHQYAVHSFKVDADGWTQSNIPGQTQRVSYKGGVCRPVNTTSAWTDTHVAAIKYRPQSMTATSAPRASGGMVPMSLAPDHWVTNEKGSAATITAWTNDNCTGFAKYAMKGQTLHGFMSAKVGRGSIMKLGYADGHWGSYHIYPKNECLDVHSGAIGISVRANK